MNINRMEISFWRHRSKQSGKAILYCRIWVGGEMADIGSTGITIWRDHWDSEHITNEDGEAFFKNEQLDIIRNQLRAIFNDLFRRKEKISAARIKRIYQGETAPLTLLSVFAMYLTDSAQDTDRNLDAQSLTVYNNVRKKLTSFLIDMKAVDLLVEEFDLAWVKKYRRWMKQVPLDGNKIGHADSYVVKHTQTIKNVLTWAKLHKLTDDNPLTGLRIKNVKFVDPVYLTNEQFDRLRAHQFTNTPLQEVADVFVILCRCGFHFGDLKDLILKHKTALRTGVDGQPWIVKDRIKTEVSARTPVFEEVSQVVTKYGGWEKLPLKSLPKFNGLLKVIAAQLDFPEDLSSKAGRKTFTDWCFNSLMLSTDSIKVLLGRKSDKGLEVYGRPDERRVVSELEQSKLLQQRRSGES